MAITKLQAESINLADTFAFSGTVTGTPTGIGHFETFNLTSNVSLSADTNTVLVWTGSSSLQASIGSSLVSHSSGIFSFSATGIYLIQIDAYYEMQANDGQSRRLQMTTQKSTDGGSNYSNISLFENSVPNSDGGEKNKGLLTGRFTLDVTNTTNDRVRILHYIQSNAAYVQGTSGLDETIIQFSKIAET